MPIKLVTLPAKINSEMIHSKARVFLSVMLFFLIQVIVLQAQIKVAPDRYRIEFTDKKHNAFTIDRPGDFLSERALQRRTKQKIGITQVDLPVSSYYVDSLTKMGFEVVNTSRWFNSAIVRCADADIEKLRKVDFIKETVSLPKKEDKAKNDTVVQDLETLFSYFFQKDVTNESLYGAPYEYYGQAANQIGMMNGHILHDNGFRGKGMLIAVIDGGFFKINELSGFDSMRNNGRLLPVKNFTVEKDDLYGSNNHGANVLSIIACNLPGRMVGSAPDADYLVLRSEETGGEYLVEEDNWIAAVEYADSIGVDLITTSLGYSTFNDTLQNHTYYDLDGNTIRASRAATMASARGMVVCVSAGNDGDMPWKYVSIPADADSIVTIGAVDVKRQCASFSSVGPTADRRIKPDLTAMGKGTAYQGSSGRINTGNGTSYSTPLLAGLIACAWQAHPDKKNMEIIEMVRLSADRCHQPDSLYGYGIPDFSKLVVSDRVVRQAESYAMTVFPNPFTGKFTLRLSPAQHGRVHIKIFNVSGRQIYAGTDYLAGYNAYEYTVEESAGFMSGMYIVETHTEAGRVTTKVMKQ